MKPIFLFDRGHPLNPYAYAVNNPLRFVDPSGLIIKVEGDSANKAYNRMKEVLSRNNMDPKYIARLLAYERNENIMIHIYESDKLHNTRGGAMTPYGIPPKAGKGSLCKNKGLHHGDQYNSPLANWDISVDGNNSELDAIIFHEIFGHIELDRYYEARHRDTASYKRPPKPNEADAIPLENNYRDWAGYPRTRLPGGL